MDQSTPVERLNEVVRARLDAHLDAVESALARAGRTRDARRAITDDLGAQLLEMLADRTGGREPSPEDMEMLLRDSDPPGAYADASAAAYPRRESPRPAAVVPIDRELKRRKTMKSLFLVSLVVSGSFLVAVPAICDFLNLHEIATLMASRPDLHNVTFDHMEEMSRFGFWLTGSLMALAGIWGGFRSLLSERGPLSNV